MSDKEENEEWEDEEATILVDLVGILEPDFFKNVKRDCSLLVFMRADFPAKFTLRKSFLERLASCPVTGIHTDKPLLQLDQYTFVGEYEDPLGSCLLFQEKKETDGGDGEKELEYYCKVEKKLKMIRAFVAPKVPKSQESATTAAKPTNEPSASTSTQGEKCNEETEANIQSEGLNMAVEDTPKPNEDV